MRVARWVAASGGHRVTTGQWDSVAESASLKQVARGLDLGPARFINYHPAPLTGATGPCGAGRG